MSSPHLQMMLASIGPKGKEPPSLEIKIDIGNGDLLSCLISKNSGPTVVLLHGLGGSAQSSYMVRNARKLYLAGFNVVRVNLRGCGTGKGLSCLPYNSGNSQDIKKVLEFLNAPATLIGFSLGGNIALKLGGELDSSKFLEHIIAICPVLSLKDCTTRIEQYTIYNNYYVNSILAQTQKWSRGQKLRTINDFDEKIIAPLWGYINADDYYTKCSSEKFIPNIAIPCDILLAKDDLFIDYKRIYELDLSASTKVWLSEKGSHMGFIGKNTFYWLDKFLLILLPKVAP